MRKKTITAILFVVAVSLAAYYAFQPQKTDSLLSGDGKGLFDFEAHWRLGNVVALIRHTERCDRSDNQCFDGKKGITTHGVEAAIKIGKAYNNLPKQTTVIYNSPVKRTRQTAEFMFDGLSTSQAWLREGCKDNLLSDIFKYKEEGKNLILVTHSTCIDALGEKQGRKLIEMDIHGEKTYGISIFVTVDKKNRKIHVLGYLFADDWGTAFN